MTTIQDRIIKDFRKTFLNIRFDTTVGTGADLEQFLIQSIKEVEEETRKETRYCSGCKEPLSDYCDHCNKLWQS